MLTLRSLSRMIAAACAVVVLAAEDAGAASATQVSEAPVDRMIALNKRAFADIQAQHFQAARYWLEEALVICETAGLDNDEMTARTYLHLAAVALGGLKDREEAMRDLDLALKINPNIALTPGLDITGLRSAYLQARQLAGLPPNPDPTAPNFDPSLPSASGAAVGEVGGDGPAAEDQAAETASGASQGPRDTRPSVREAYAAALVQEPDLPARVPVPLYCSVPVEIAAGQDLVVRCVTQKQPHTASAVFHFRPDGQEVPFAELAMDRTPKGWLAAVVPAKQMSGKALSYYITARLANVEQPLYWAYPEAPRALAIRGGIPATGRPESGGMSKDRGGSPRASRRRAAGALWFAVGAGSGVVYHGRATVDSGARLPGASSPAPVQRGLSPASLVQLEPELGYQVSRRLSLSLLGRYQYAPMEEALAAHVSGEKPVPTSAFALFFLGRLWSSSAHNLQAFASGGFGVGRSFLAVIDRDCDGGACALPHSDTLHGSGAAVTASAGVLYHATPRLGVFAELREIATFPTVMALTELDLGLAFVLPAGHSSGDRVAGATPGLPGSAGPPGPRR